MGLLINRKYNRWMVVEHISQHLCEGEGEEVSKGRRERRREEEEGSPDLTMSCLNGKNGGIV